MQIYKADYKEDLMATWSFTIQCLVMSCSPFNAFTSNTAGLRTESLTAHIMVIPKAGKDPTCCGSYRPISLFNADVKLFAKVMATRLLPLLPKSIIVDQTGFIPQQRS